MTENNYENEGLKVRPKKEEIRTDSPTLDKIVEAAPISTPEKNLRDDNNYIAPQKPAELMSREALDDIHRTTLKHDKTRLNMYVEDALKAGATVEELGFTPETERPLKENDDVAFKPAGQDAQINKSNTVSYNSDVQPYASHLRPSEILSESERKLLLAGHFNEGIIRNCLDHPIENVLSYAKDQSRPLKLQKAAQLIVDALRKNASVDIDFISAHFSEGIEQEQEKSGTKQYSCLNDTCKNVFERDKQINYCGQCGEAAPTEISPQQFKDKVKERKERVSDLEKKAGKVKREEILSDVRDGIDGITRTVFKIVAYPTLGNFPGDLQTKTENSLIKGTYDAVKASKISLATNAAVYTAIGALTGYMLDAENPMRGVGIAGTIIGSYSLLEGAIRTAIGSSRGGLKYTGNMVKPVGSLPVTLVVNGIRLASSIPSKIYNGISNRINNYKKNLNERVSKRLDRGKQ